jgi:hypothetical protein
MECTGNSFTLSFLNTVINMTRVPLPYSGQMKGSKACLNEYIEKNEQ